MTMETGPRNGRTEGGAAPTPTGGIQLSPARLTEIAQQWQGTAQSLRRMDELALGEIEPATLFVWEEE
ncbi:MAG: hypothetical protein ACYC66_17585 [Chloroflexota bacterium]